MTDCITLQGFIVLNNPSGEGVTLSNEQLVVFNWLNDELRLPVYASVYNGAVDLLARKPPGYIVFVCHAGRELMNGLASTVTDKDRQQVQYVNFFDDLENHWNDKWGARGLNERDRSKKGHCIPYEICEKIKDMISEHIAGRLRPREVAALFCTTFLGYDDNVTIPPNFIEEWLVTRDWFFDFTHLGNEDFPEDASTEIIQQFQSLDNFLYVAASSEFERIRYIHGILEETNERIDRQNH